MTTIVSFERRRFQSVLAAGAVVLLCIGLVACPGSTGATSAPAAAAQSPGVAPASRAVGPSTAPVGASGGTGAGAASPCTLLTQAEAVAAVGRHSPQESRTSRWGCARMPQVTSPPGSI